MEDWQLVQKCLVLVHMGPARTREVHPREGPREALPITKLKEMMAMATIPSKKEPVVRDIANSNRRD